MTNLSTPKPFEGLQSDAPIGIFDSGVGGLTVVRRIMERLPNERIVYFGDTARVPYGTKSVPTIRKYAAEDTALLLKESPKVIVAACNTVSALALDIVAQVANGIPTIGVVAAGARLAAERSPRGCIGVIGTEATISSGAYYDAIKHLKPTAKVFSKACPLFVPLAEEGLLSHLATRLIAEDYLSELITQEIDTLVLGCTHYPLLRNVIADVVGESVLIIDSAEAVALEVELLLCAARLLNPNVHHLPSKFIVSDLPTKFNRIAECFLGFLPQHIEVIFPDLH
ncbi:MAG: glutamate racemase [[Chlorobium] sp. 445]|nr:MAG: glutamate racemase [[Chlorobium] sp. 445]